MADFFVILLVIVICSLFIGAPVILLVIFSQFDFAIGWWFLANGISSGSYTALIIAAVAIWFGNVRLSAYRHAMDRRRDG